MASVTKLTGRCVEMHRTLLALLPKYFYMFWFLSTVQYPYSLKYTYSTTDVWLKVSQDTGGGHQQAYGRLLVGDLTTLFGRISNAEIHFSSGMDWTFKQEPQFFKSWRSQSLKSAGFICFAISFDICLIVSKFQPSRWFEALLKNSLVVLLLYYSLHFMQCISFPGNQVASKHDVPPPYWRASPLLQQMFLWSSLEGFFFVQVVSCKL